MGWSSGKLMAVTVVALAGLIGVAQAGDGFKGGRPGSGPGWGHGGQGGGKGGWGYGSGLNVFVDIPVSGAGSASAAPQDRRYDYCRDVRHSCFGAWGVEEPGYGRCMRSAGC